jgi:hypothetical protein
MNSSISFQNLRESSDRRTGADRRHFSYAFYIPERRNVEAVESARDRRSGSDRRMDDKSC